MELTNSGATPPLSARGPGLCFPLASLGSLGWGHKVGLGKAGVERGEAGRQGASDTDIRTSHPLWAWWLDSGGRRRKDGRARI